MIQVIGQGVLVFLSLVFVLLLFQSGFVFDICQFIGFELWFFFFLEIYYQCLWYLRDMYILGIIILNIKLSGIFL